jgi:ATP-binding cassette subfamily F protein uup
LVLTGANTFGGASSVAAGTLQIGSGGTVGSLGTVAISGNGSLVFSRSDATTWAGTLSGGMALTKLGTNTLTLTGNHAHSGITTISGGTLKLGTKLEVLYFDQMRAQINGDLTVADNIADGNETVTVNGRTRHVINYLQDFLFEPARARTPARVLSGGERNRLLLARLFTKPANVLVMDEPTNDLDAETLDLLEDLLVEYQGTLLVVSHDRDFLDNVVTSTLVFEGDGRIGDYIGGYSDWMAEKAKREAAAKAKAEVRTVRPEPDRASGAAAPRRRKLNNKEQRELETLPAKIEALEKEQAELTAKLADPDFYKNEAAKFAQVKARLEVIEAEHATAFARWEELEAGAAQD